MKVTTHYDYSQNIAKLNAFAEKRAKRLVALFNKPAFKGYIPLLVYSGMSGISFATLLGLHLGKLNKRYGMAYVRKDKEESHGQKIEFTIYSSDAKYQFVFVDDFICSGSTFEHALSNSIKTLRADISHISHLRFSNPLKTGPWRCDKNSIIAALHKKVTNTIIHNDILLKKVEKLDNSL